MTKTELLKKKNLDRITSRTKNQMKRIYAITALSLGLLALGANSQSRPHKGRRRRMPPPKVQKPEPKKVSKKAKTRPLAIRGGIYHLGNGNVVRDATLLIEDGKIKALGFKLNLPKGTKILDGRDKHICPGFIMVQAPAIGLRGRPSKDFKDYYNPFDQTIRRALAVGITSYLFFPARGGSLPSGNSAVLRLIPRDLDEILVKAGTLKSMSVPRSPSAWKKLRELVEKARKFQKEKTAYEAKKAAGDSKAKAPKLSKSAATLLPILEGKAKLYLSGAQTVPQIREALRLAKLFGKGVVLAGAVEGWIIPDEIAMTHSSCILQPRVHVDPDPTRLEKNGSNIEGPKILSKAGVTLTVVPPPGRFGGSGMGLGGLLGRDLNTPFMDACIAVRGGMDNEKALSTITLQAAKLLGVEDKIGSLEVGKDADILILDGDPLSYKSFVETAIVLGKIRYEKEKEPFYKGLKNQ